MPSCCSRCGEVERDVHAGTVIECQFCGEFDYSIGFDEALERRSELDAFRKAFDLTNKPWSTVKITQVETPEYLGMHKPKPTATMWVAKDPDGTPRPMLVTDMTDSHLWRWIRYFRKKHRDNGFHGSDQELDAVIQLDMITAPAIYAEAEKRGVIAHLTVQSGTTIMTPDPGPNKVTVTSYAAKRRRDAQQNHRKPREQAVTQETAVVPGVRRIILEDE